MEIFAVLALLACPVGMGLMMWFMSRGIGGRKRDDQARDTADLRAERDALDKQIAQLERSEQRDVSHSRS